MEIQPWKKILFALIPAIVLIALAETICRMFFIGNPAGDRVFGRAIDPDRNLMLAAARKNYTDFQTDVDPYNGYRLKESDRPDGLRPPRLPVPSKEPGEVRIVCLGDSTTYGIFLDEKQTWPYRLEVALNRWAPEGTTFHVYNCGVPGYAPQHSKRILQSRYIQIEPDIIFFREEPVFPDTVDLPKPMSEMKIQLNRFLYKSRFVYLMTALGRMALNPRGPFWHMYDHPASLDDGYSDEVLPLFVNWCRDRGVELFLGVEYLIYYGSPDSMWPAEVTCKQYVCHDPDVPVAGNANLWGFYSGSLQFVPCLKDFESHPDGPEALFSDVVHLTEKGADLLARVISDYVKSNWAEISKTLYDDRQPSGLLQGLESMNPGKDSESARINER